jgi:hypothetical protein
MSALIIYQPAQLSDPEIALSAAKYRLLAQGDSWFSFGALNLPKNSNLLFEMQFPDERCAINCAVPGATLGHMVDNIRAVEFYQLLCGKRWRPWDGLLLSCGGNDLIDALGDDSVLDPTRRLLLAPGERPANPLTARDYISASGWARFASYLRGCFDELIQMRDSRAPNQNIPVFMHGYHYPTIRNSASGLGKGPWLYTSAKSLSIPETIWPTLVQQLYGDFAQLMQSIASSHSNVHFFNSAALVGNIVAATPGSTGASGDWINEIHLDWRGYEKIARPWCNQISTVLP